MALVQRAESGHSRARQARRDRPEHLGDAAMTTTALDARWAAAQAGLSRGWIETRQNLTETANVVGHVIPPVANLAVLLFMRRVTRGKTVPGTDFPLVAMVLPSLLGMTIAYGGLCAPAPSITADREDGTLLRAKATPNGMLGYLVGKIVMFTSTTLLGVLAIVIPGIMIVDNLILDARAWLLLALIFVVGMVSTVPIGVALGSLMKSSVQAMLVPLACTLIMGVSGIFYPITVLPTWLQWVAQAFPVYWLGLGVRSAMLPAEVVAAEIGQSWRTVEMFAVLGVWAVIGFAARTDPAAPHGPASVGIRGGQGARTLHDQRILTGGGLQRRRPQPGGDAARRTPHLAARAGRCARRALPDHRLPRTRRVQSLSAPGSSHRGLLRCPGRSRVLPEAVQAPRGVRKLPRGCPARQRQSNEATSPNERRSCSSRLSTSRVTRRWNARMCASAR